MDQYSILGRIGEGAHGIVFKAKHIEVRLMLFFIQFKDWTRLENSARHLNLETILKRCGIFT